MKRIKGRARKFEDPDEIIAKDYDPESDVSEREDGSGSIASNDERLATEHYVSVGNSKLRQKENVSLGPEYRGSRISRSALDEDGEDGEYSEEEDDESEYDDPDVVDLEADEAAANDSEIDSDAALDASDAERFKKFTFLGSSNPARPKGKAGRAKAADYMTDDDEEESEAMEMKDGLAALTDSGGSDSEDNQVEDYQDDDGSEDDNKEKYEDDDALEEESTPIRPSLDARPSLSALSSRADVDKGIAIQKQRKIYDGLLNLRIRLQKALVAANSFPTAELEGEVESEPYEAAEEAAIKLLNTISSLRENFGPQVIAGTKRKRGLEMSMSNADIWEQLQEEDAAAAGFRGDCLEKWSKKVQSVSVPRTNNGFGVQNKTLVTALREQLVVPNNRLIKRTRVPRSCAPAQLSQKVAEDDYIYDDADFYQLLLRELVDQRTVEGNGDQAIAMATVMVTASKEAKMRKQVDRKASKGRKMRFTVHEKLQNFMASEDRRSWEQCAIDRFFGTLFGRKMQLNEDESEDEDMGGIDAEEEGLKLFRG